MANPLSAILLQTLLHTTTTLNLKLTQLPELLDRLGVNSDLSQCMLQLTSYHFQSNNTTGLSGSSCLKVISLPSPWKLQQFYI